MRWAVLLGTLFAACEPGNAILELQLTLPLPPDPADCDDCVAFARVQAFAADADSDCIARDGIESEVFALAEEIEPMSIVSTRFNIDLEVRVGFCVEEDCEAVPGDGEVEMTRFIIEHPFYQGEFTSLGLEVAEIPAASAEGTCDEPIAISKCKVFGCSSGSDPTACESNIGCCYGFESEVHTHWCE